MRVDCWCGLSRSGTAMKITSHGCSVLIRRGIGYILIPRPHPRPPDPSPPQLRCLTPIHHRSITHLKHDGKPFGGRASSPSSSGPALRSFLPTPCFGLFRSSLVRLVQRGIQALEPLGAPSQTTNTECLPKPASSTSVANFSMAATLVEPAASKEETSVPIQTPKGPQPNGKSTVETIRSAMSSLVPSVKDVELGMLGILHPSVLEKFEIDFPCSALEFNLELFKKESLNVWGE